MADRNVVYKDREYVVRYTKTESGEPAMMIVRELVRCKDCTEYQQNFHWCRLHDVEMQPTDYCSYGERKDGDPT